MADGFPLLGVEAFDNVVLEFGVVHSGGIFGMFERMGGVMLRRIVREVGVEWKCRGR